MLEQEEFSIIINVETKIGGDRMCGEEGSAKRVEQEYKLDIVYEDGTEGMEHIRGKNEEEAFLGVIDKVLGLVPIEIINYGKEKGKYEIENSKK